MASTNLLDYGIEERSSFTLFPVDKQALVDKVHQQIQDAIVTGRFSQGQRINETILARQLGTSRGPIREALAGLLNQGLLVKIPNRGVFVMELAAADLEELWALRSMYEQFALRYALTHDKPLPLKALQRIVDDIAIAFEGADVETEVSALDLKFHTVLIAAAGLPRLLAAWNDLTPQLRMMLTANNTKNAAYLGAVKSHQVLLDALRNGDLPAAKKVLKEHIQGSYRTWVSSR